MPLIGSLDVAQILDEPKYHPKPFSESQVKTMLRQLLSALEFCHSHSVIHRDIKPSNMLYSFDGVLKLADFGLSRHIFPDQRYLTANVVSLWYRAPELLMKRNNNSYSFGIDLWALGCVFAELLQGVPLLPGKDESNQIFRLNSCLGPPPSALFPDGVRINPSDSTDDLWDRFANLSIEGLTLLTKLLEYDNIERWTANQALESKYFKVEPLPANLMPKFS
jgi:serine/threonine protein kinase